MRRCQRDCLRVVLEQCRVALFKLVPRHDYRRRLRLRRSRSARQLRLCRYDLPLFEVNAHFGLMYAAVAERGLIPE